MNKETTFEIVKPTKIIVYDFETTGLLDKIDVQPIELAALIIDVDGDVKTIHKYIKSPDSVESMVIKPGVTISTLTGITDKMLEELGEDLEAVMYDFEMELEAASAETHCIVGHNILKYDNPLYNMMQERLGRKHRITDNKCFDTGGQFKGHLMGWEKFENLFHYQYQNKCLEAYSRVRWNLTAAGLHYGIKVNEGKAHAAIVDVQNNLQVFIKQLKKIGKVPENLLALEL